jgi:hypothetical protein
MISARRPAKELAPDPSDLVESIRVLSAVVTELSERIEVLEAREALSRAAARPVSGL